MKIRPPAESIPLPKNSVPSIKEIDELETSELEELFKNQEKRYKKIESEINSHIQQIELNNIYISSIDSAIDNINHIFSVNMFNSKENEEIYRPYIIKVPYQVQMPTEEAKGDLKRNIKITREEIKGKTQIIKNEMNRKQKLEDELDKRNKSKRL